MPKLFPITWVFLFLIAAQSFAGGATWSSNPVSGDWNTAANWIPNTVPNGASDTATFETSDVTNITISSAVTVASCIFEQDANAFFIISQDSAKLSFAGAGVINNSTTPQNFIADSSGDFEFINKSTIAGLVRFTMTGTPIGQGGADVVFRDDSSAGSATFINEPGDFEGGNETFLDNSTAGNARFVCRSNSNEGSGQVSFNDLSSAGHGTFIVEGCGNPSPASTSLFFSIIFRPPTTPRLRCTARP